MLPVSSALSVTAALGQPEPTLPPPCSLASQQCPLATPNQSSPFLSPSPVASATPFESPLPQSPSGTTLPLGAVPDTPTFLPHLIGPPISPAALALASPMISTTLKGAHCSSAPLALVALAPHSGQKSSAFPPHPLTTSVGIKDSGPVTSLSAPIPSLEPKTSPTEAPSQEVPTPKAPPISPGLVSAGPSHFVTPLAPVQSEVASCFQALPATSLALTSPQIKGIPISSALTSPQNLVDLSLKRGPLNPPATLSLSPSSIPVTSNTPSVLHTSLGSHLAQLNQISPGSLIQSLAQTGPNVLSDPQVAHPVGEPCSQKSVSSPLPSKNETIPTSLASFPVETPTFSLTFPQGPSPSTSIASYTLSGSSAVAASSLPLFSTASLTKGFSNTSHHQSSVGTTPPVKTNTSVPSVAPTTTSTQVASCVSPVSSGLSNSKDTTSHAALAVTASLTSKQLSVSTVATTLGIPASPLPTPEDPRSVPTSRLVKFPAQKDLQTVPASLEGIPVSPIQAGLPTSLPLALAAAKNSISPQNTSSSESLVAKKSLTEPLPGAKSSTSPVSGSSPTFMIKTDTFASPGPAGAQPTSPLTAPTVTTFPLGSTITVGVASAGAKGSCPTTVASALLDGADSLASKSQSAQKGTPPALPLMVPTSEICPVTSSMTLPQNVLGAIGQTSAVLKSELAHSSPTGPSEAKKNVGISQTSALTSEVFNKGFPFEDPNTSVTESSKGINLASPPSSLGPSMSPQTKRLPTKNDSVTSFLPEVNLTFQDPKELLTKKYPSTLPSPKGAPPPPPPKMASSPPAKAPVSLKESLPIPFIKGTPTPSTATPPSSKKSPAPPSPKEPSTSSDVIPPFPKRTPDMPFPEDSFTPSASPSQTTPAISLSQGASASLTTSSPSPKESPAPKGTPVIPVAKEASVPIAESPKKFPTTKGVPAFKDTPALSAQSFKDSPTPKGPPDTSAELLKETTASKKAPATLVSEEAPSSPAQLPKEFSASKKGPVSPGSKGNFSPSAQSLESEALKVAPTSKDTPTPSAQPPKGTPASKKAPTPKQDPTPSTQPPKESLASKGAPTSEDTPPPSAQPPKESSIPKGTPASKKAPDAPTSKEAPIPSTQSPKESPTPKGAPTSKDAPTPLAQSPKETSASKKLPTTSSKQEPIPSTQSPKESLASKGLPTSEDNPPPVAQSTKEPPVPKGTPASKKTSTPKQEPTPSAQPPKESLASKGGPTSEDNPTPSAQPPKESPIPKGTPASKKAPTAPTSKEAPIPSTQSPKGAPTSKDVPTPLAQPPKETSASKKAPTTPNSKEAPTPSAQPPKESPVPSGAPTSKDAPTPSAQPPKGASASKKAPKGTTASKKAPTTPTSKEVSIPSDQPPKESLAFKEAPASKDTPTSFTQPPKESQIPKGAPTSEDTSIPSIQQSKELPAPKKTSASKKASTPTPKEAPTSSAQPPKESQTPKGASASQKAPSSKEAPSSSIQPPKESPAPRGASASKKAPIISTSEEASTLSTQPPKESPVSKEAPTSSTQPPKESSAPKGAPASKKASTSKEAPSLPAQPPESPAPKVAPPSKKAPTTPISKEVPTPSFLIPESTNVIPVSKDLSIPSAQPPEVSTAPKHAVAILASNEAPTSTLPPKESPDPKEPPKTTPISIPSALIPQSPKGGPATPTSKRTSTSPVSKDLPSVQPAKDSVTLKGTPAILSNEASAPSLESPASKEVPTSSVHTPKKSPDLSRTPTTPSAKRTTTTRAAKGASTSVALSSPEESPGSDSLQASKMLSIQKNTTSQKGSPASKSPTLDPPAKRGTGEALATALAAPPLRGSSKTTETLPISPLKGKDALSCPLVPPGSEASTPVAVPAAEKGLLRAGSASVSAAPTPSASLPLAPSPVPPLLPKQQILPSSPGLVLESPCKPSAPADEDELPPLIPPEPISGGVPFQSVLVNMPTPKPAGIPVPAPSAKQPVLKNNKVFVDAWLFN
ncbi:nascent polypeptide-associated complex subunit alpha, muscle-specific form-like [Suncus etruscus]|uniref:nascent polypeptide-associated complex subunit alpha, muscle-specific form-like n=1 Tax=Suncus etruscus TaxID=109475 RepID=UPI00210F23CC|nr:nascent polypeptide-associated complex subunit alpha, muscle-specific form-like [Suncus etruscus]